MKKTFSPFLLPLAILLYAAISSRALLQAWTFSPYDAFGWLAFIIWLIPVPLFLAFYHLSAGTPPYQPPLLVLAISCNLLGMAASLNALNYLGLAFSLAAFLPLRPALALWLACSISWMPAFSWVGSHLFPDHLVPIRLAAAVIGTASWLILSKRDNHLPH